MKAFGIGIALVGVAISASGTTKERIAEIAGYLPEKPGLTVPAASDRETWENREYVSDNVRSHFVKNGEKILKEPIPECPDELYLEFLKNGNRTNFQNPYFKRLANFNLLVMAETLEYKGRFLGKIGEYLNAICSETSWTMPAHDPQLTSFKGTKLFIDLGSTSRAIGVSKALALLGERLPADVRKKAFGELRRRVLDVYLECAAKCAKDGKPSLNGWWFNRANWNAVCHSGCTRAALAVLPDRIERATFVAWEESATKFYLSGFGKDGWCAEGMGYWNYGFGNHLMGGLTILQTTGGKVNIFADEMTRKAAEAGYTSMLQNGEAPNFADGGGKQADGWILGLVRLVYPDLTCKRITGAEAKDNAWRANPASMFLRAFGQEKNLEAHEPYQLPVRSWFPSAQVLLSRPKKGGRLALAVKGGTNGEPHNHNDLGSYTLLLDGKPCTGDPGGEVYTRRTFSRRRYESNVLNSYGHPVPMAGGELQEWCNEFSDKRAAKVLDTKFAEDADEITFDIAGGYEDKKGNIVKLTRKFRFDRMADTVTITDEAEFKEDAEFEVPVISRYWIRAEEDGKNARMPNERGEQLNVNFAADGEFALEKKTLKDPGHADVQRLAAKFAKKGKKFRLVTTFAATRASSEQWRVKEMSFTGYPNDSAADVRAKVTFRHKESGETIVRPMFWDGGNIFKVRFAPTKTGRWEWESKCATDWHLNEKGAFDCVKYGGKLELYKRGFVKAAKGKKHFTYADGTPFFYLGDTHWGMYREELDEAGPNAAGIKTDSHFKYIVDRRVKQGFTVYQSEPISSPFNLRDGTIDANDIDGFRKADEYYKYIADAGLVHANAEICFTAEMPEKLRNDEAALERIARYWVARFGAYPVMWTIAQEVDNDALAKLWVKNSDGSKPTFRHWKKVAEYLHKYDGYRHPLSAHQVNMGSATVTGAGTRWNCSGGGGSTYADAETVEKTGHNWWAAQGGLWGNIYGLTKFARYRDYWRHPDPAVVYEGSYSYLATKERGARMQIWRAMLNGFCGYGYGVIDMWLYKSNYEINSTANDGEDTVTPQDKRIPWGVSVNFPCGEQMGVAKRFFQGFDWWHLIPDFDDGRKFQSAHDEGYAAASIGNDRYVVYVWHKFGDRHTGTLREMADADYEVKWIDPITGQSAGSWTIHPTDAGTYQMPDKPDERDWTFMAVKTNGAKPKFGGAKVYPAAEFKDVKIGAGKAAVIDFGPAAAGGYAKLEVSECTAKSGSIRVTYSCHPDGMTDKGDFWRETAARYLGDDVDLPILPGNIDRFEVYPMAKGVHRAKLLQGLVRYAMIRNEGNAGSVTVKSFELVNDKVHSEGERSGTFDCAKDGLKAIWEASVRTCELSAIPEYDSVWGAKKGKTLPYLADGAKRDRLVWSGDLWWAQRSYYNGFKCEAPHMKGSIRMLAANQTPEGYVQASPWPDQAKPKAGEWGPFGSDEFACWIVPILRDHYLHTGDKALMAETYPAVRKLMAYLKKYQNAESGIFEQRKETCKHAAGLVFGGTSLHHRSYMNILLWMTYRDAAFCAETMGETKDVAAWKAECEKLAKSIRATFWDEKCGYFRISAEDGTIGQEANALALASRFATAEEAKRIMPRLSRIQHGKFQAMAARGKFMYGGMEEGLKMIDNHNWRKILDPGWEGVRLTTECMHMIRKGWGDEAHPDTAVAGLFTNYILGIEPTKAGFEEFSFTVPVTKAGISWASGNVPTPKGTISASWCKKGEGKVEVFAMVPRGAKCMLKVPGNEMMELKPGTFKRILEYK